VIQRRLPAVRASLAALRLALYPALLSILLLVACSPPGANFVPTFVPPATPGPPAASTYTVEYGDIAESIVMRGRVAAAQEALLMFPLAGTLKALHISPGDRVRAGDLLAELDAPGAEQEVVRAQFNLEQALRRLEVAELQRERVAQPPLSTAADLLAAQIALERAAAELRYAQIEYDRALSRPWDPPETTEAYSWTLQLNVWNYELAQANLAQVQQAQQQSRNSQRIDQAIQELEVEIAQGQVEQARWLEAVALEKLSNTQLMAPFSGLVVSIEKRAGDQVGAYEVVGVVADPDDLWIVATILEQDVERIAVGQPATVRLDAYPNEKYVGAVLQISSQSIHWQGQTAYEVTVALDGDQDAPAVIRMGADVTVAGRSKEAVLLVPTSAILTIGGRPYVELVAAEHANDVERVEIQIGLANDAQTEVVAGLEAGQIIRIP